MTTATRTRPRLRDHVHVNARVINTDSFEVYKVQNLWDSDRAAQLINRDGARLTVTYADLWAGYELIQPFGGAR